MDWMAGHKPANSGSGKKLWRQYNEEQLQKVSHSQGTQDFAELLGEVLICLAGNASVLQWIRQVAMPPPAHCC